MTGFLPPGLHAGIPSQRYHADDLCAIPTLSSSIAKTLIGKTPRHAFVEHPRLSPPEAKEESKFDLGTVAHEVILGRGGGFAVGDFPNWATKAAKEFRDSCRRDGLTPILGEQMQRVGKMAEAAWTAVWSIPGCNEVLRADHGQAETVGIWQDIGGPLCRMMLDWIGPTQALIWDVKTTGVGLSNAELSRLIDNLNYDLSAAFYLRGLQHLLPALIGQFRWCWIFVEDDEPFEVRIIEADAEQIGRGHRKAALAIAKWQRCMTSGVWPGYPREITRVGAPGWAEAQWNERESADPDWDGALLLDHHPIPPLSPDTTIFGERLIQLPPEAA